MRFPTPPSYAPESLFRLGIPLSVESALRVCAHRSPRELRSLAMALLRFSVSTAHSVGPSLAGPCGSTRSVFGFGPLDGLLLTRPCCEGSLAAALTRFTLRSFSTDWRGRGFPLPALLPVPQTRFSILERAAVFRALITSRSYPRLGRASACFRGFPLGRWLPLPWLTVWSRAILLHAFDVARSNIRRPGVLRSSGRGLPSPTSQPF